MLVDSKAKRGWWFWWWSPACLIARWLMQSMMPSLWPHDRPAAWGNMLLVMSCLICWWLGDSTRAALQVAAKPGTWLRVLKEIKAWETRGNWKGCCLLIACCVYASLNLTQVALSSSSMFSYLFSCLKWSPFRAEPSIAMKLWTKSQRICCSIELKSLPAPQSADIETGRPRCVSWYIPDIPLLANTYMRCPYNDLCRYSMSKEWVSVVRARLAEDVTSCAEGKEGVQPGVGSFWEMVLIWYALIDIRRF